MNAELPAIEKAKMDIGYKLSKCPASEKDMLQKEAEILQMQEKLIRQDVSYKKDATLPVLSMQVSKLNAGYKQAVDFKNAFLVALSTKYKFELGKVGVDFETGEIKAV